jgi:hypothetical protein
VEVKIDSRSAHRYGYGGGRRISIAVFEKKSKGEAAGERAGLPMQKRIAESGKQAIEYRRANCSWEQVTARENLRK